MESIACPLCGQMKKNLSAHMRLVHPESMPPKNPVPASPPGDAKNSTVASADTQYQQADVDSLVAAIKTEIAASFQNEIGGLKAEITQLREQSKTDLASVGSVILEEAKKVAQGQVKHTFDQLAAQAQAQQQNQGTAQGNPQASSQGGGGGGDNWVQGVAKMLLQQAMAGQGGGGLGGQGGNQALLNQIAFLGQLQAALAKPAEEAAYRQQRNLIDILSISTKAEIPLDRTLAAMNEVVERGRPKEEGK